MEVLCRNQISTGFDQQPIHQYKKEIKIKRQLNGIIWLKHNQFFEIKKNPMNIILTNARLYH